MMKDLLNLSIEELEHILAVAPYSEIHQMAYSIKKNELNKGALYQIDEGSFYDMYINQQELTKALIHSDESEKISTETGIEKSKDVNLETAATDISDQEKKVKKKKKKKKKIKAEPADIKKKPKKKKKEKIKVEASDTKKKKKKKVKGNESGKAMDLQIDSTSGLSDFSTWLLSHSSSSKIHSLSKSEKKKKKKKGKKKQKKLKKDQSVVSEPLANLLAAQGHAHQAIEMYKKLILIFPEKSAFFAAEIEKIQNQK